jgi:hypothetical protein
MKTKSHRAEHESKVLLMTKVADLWPVAKGSLAQTRSPCIRKNCKACASGRKHPKLIFTFREDGRLRGMYVEQVRQAIANGRELEKLMTAAGRELVLSLRQEKDA